MLCGCAPASVGVNKPPLEPPRMITGINKAGRAALNERHTSHKSNLPLGNFMNNDTLTIITASLCS